MNYKVFEVVDRDINIPSRIQKINVQADVNAEKLVLKLPRYYGDIDLTTLDLVMYIKGVDVSDIIAIRNYDVDGNAILWNFIPQGAMLSKSGYIDIQVNGVKLENDNLVIKWQTKVKKNSFYINKTIVDAVETVVKPLPTELEQYRTEIIGLIESVDLDKVVMDITGDTENVIVLHRGDGSTSNVSLNVRGGITLDEVNQAVGTHNASLEAHQDIRGKITENTNKIGDLQTSKADKNNSSFTGTMKLNNKDVATTEKTVNIGFGDKSIVVTGKNILAIGQGKYFGIPINGAVDGVAYYDVSEGDNGNYRRIVCRDWLSINTYENQCVNGNWTGWKQIATTEKSKILLTPKVGISITKQDCYILNGELFLNISLKKTDDTLFAQGSLWVCDIPIAFKTCTLNSICENVDGWILGSGGALAIDWNRQIQVNVMSPNTKTIQISGKVAI